MPYKQMSYSFGELLVAWEEETVVYLDFGLSVERAMDYLTESSRYEAPLPPHLRQAFEAYEKHQADAFDQVQCRLDVTDFQRRVLTSLRTIPFGKTASYGTLAKMIGSEKAARAVGGALNRNPIALIYPCHRIIGASGKLTGFASGIDHKQALLAHETGERR
ncbi:methylated-DNA--[protein]-cysteine S-methyltransferase [Exiguobacterium sp. s193]|uniref:methylated-DNA--[protein]-cysteine S-methyltransferase n=1 Tax=Exiguobacterium sp. s193 TaxID=2751207 RepID=UPI001BE568BA|nr:methylated-DNA--[protein]-cysteine S-methyltransferase [Exiguobacterium sp. s193]